MGTPNPKLSEFGDFVINGRMASVPKESDDDFIPVMSNIFEIVRGLKRWVTIPTIGDQLKVWIRAFADSANTPRNVLTTRGLFLCEARYGGISFYFLDENLRILQVAGGHHDGNGLYATGGNYWTPVIRRKLTIEQFRKVLEQDGRYASPGQTAYALRQELKALHKTILERASYVKSRINQLEAIETRYDQTE